MIRRAALSVPSFLVLAAIAVLAFCGVAHAANVVAGDEGSILDLIRPVFQALASHQYSLTAALSIIMVTALLKRYAGDRIPFLHSNAGGSILVLVGASTTAAAAALATPGAVVTLALMKTALVAGIAAAGTYALLKNLVIDPFIRPFAAHAPGWLQGPLNLLLVFFDHPADANPTVIEVSDAVPQAILVSEKAGASAVTASPGSGVQGVVGKPGDLK